MKDTNRLDALLLDADESRIVAVTFNGLEHPTVAVGKRVCEIRSSLARVLGIPPKSTVRINGRLAEEHEIVRTGTNVIAF